MTQYWYIFLLAILCALFSKQIDRAMERVIQDSKKRAVLYCIVGGVMLAIIGFFLYGALDSIMQNNHAVFLAIVPLSLFLVGIVAGIWFAKARQRKQSNTQ